MKKYFRGHYRLSDQENKELWANAVFVFDANVLLSLYSLPEKAREAMLLVLEQLRDRIWIPFQVATEFHRNRFAKIKTANEGILQLQEKLQSAPGELKFQFSAMDFEKWNTGIDNLDSLLQEAQSIYEKLGAAVEAASKKLPKISLDDPIAERIASLFENRIGNPPADQAELEMLYVDGEERYSKKIPPGFADKRKELLHYDRGLSTPAVYGDLILWRQLIRYAKDQNISHLVFVTADAKEDWWISEKKGQILGPHPSLVHEFYECTTAKLFWMYSPDKFLEHAGELLSLKEVTQTTVQQVKQTVIRDEIDQAKERISGFGLREANRILKNQVASGVSNLDIREARRILEQDERYAAMFNDPTENRIFHQRHLHHSQLSALRAWVIDRHPGCKIQAAINIDIAAVRDDELVAGYDIIFQDPFNFSRISRRLAHMPELSGLPLHLIVLVQSEDEMSAFRSLISTYAKMLQEEIKSKWVSSIFFCRVDDDRVHVLAEIDSSSYE